MIWYYEISWVYDVGTAENNGSLLWDYGMVAYRGYLASGPSRELKSLGKANGKTIQEFRNISGDTFKWVLDGIFVDFCCRCWFFGWMNHDEPLGACHWFPIEENSWIQDSMPTRKKRGVAGKCTLPTGFVHNHTRTWFLRFVWSFARGCLGLLRFYWDLSEGWPIFGIWVDFF